MPTRPHPLTPSPKRERVFKPDNRLGESLFHIKSPVFCFAESTPFIRGSKTSSDQTLPFKGSTRVKRGGGIKWAALLILFSLLSSLSPIKAQYYNGANLNYGRSRVQYYTDKFVWSFYRYEKYDVYFYTGGKNLAEYTARYAAKRLPEIERLFDVDMEEDRIQFVVYNRQTHFIQSNAGLNTEGGEQNASNVDNVQGLKVFIYFDGNHQNFEKQIAEGIARVLFNSFMYGHQLRDRIKYLPVNNLPEWYTEGLYAYAASPWNVEADNQMASAMRNPAFFKLNRLTTPQAKLAGQSIWNYLAQTYGENIISKIIYMTKMGRSANNGLLYVLGLNINALRAQWINFYDKQYPPAQDSLRNGPSGNLVTRIRNDRQYYNFTTSNNGSNIAYVLNRKGRYKVYYTNPGTSPIKIYKGGDQIEQAADVSYPLLAWNPADNMVTLLVEKKGELWLIDYDLSTKKRTEKPIYHFDKITSMRYMPDGQNLLLSAVRDGITDIYLYNLPSNTYKALTTDIPDDLTPLYFNNGIVFSSNRKNDSLSLKLPQHLVAPFTDLFRLPLQGKPALLQRVTNTPTANETQPVFFDSSRIAFIGTQTGIPNRYTAMFDSVVAFVDTAVHYRFTSSIAPLSNYRYPIAEQSAGGSRTTLLFTLDKKNSAVYFDTPTESKSPEGALPTYYATHGRDTTWKKFKNPISIGKGERIKVFEDTTQKKEKQIDINNYEFEDEKGKPKVQQAPAPPPLPMVVDSSDFLPDSFKLPKQRIYLTSFYADGFSAKFDRNFLNQGYQPFSPGGYSNPPINGLFKVTLRDVMEDYRITGAFRLSTTLVGNEYLLRFENLKHRLDRELVLHRMGVQNGFDNTKREQVHQIIYGVRYPFKQTLWLKGSVLGRLDRTVYTGARPENLGKPTQFAYWSALHTEGVFDNTIRNGINILYGTRAKVWAEFYYRFDKPKTNTTIIGIDFRHYQRIHRNFIAAFRVAASTSFGAGKLMYYMGGVDGALAPRFDANANIDNTQTYLFQALANGVRGFSQNIRNGNTFMLASAELRLPIFKYLLNVNVRSEIVNNFQVVAFADAGSAYVGLNPYAEINTFTTRTIQQGPLNITVKTQREPFIAGFGWGLRTKLLGYFLRADLARGLENGHLNKTRFYLSFGADF